MQANFASFRLKLLVRFLFVGAATFLFVDLAISRSASQETTLFAFQGRADGGNPLGGLISDTEGALYGVSWASNTPGNVFRLQPPVRGQTAWTETVLANGVRPQGGLVFDQRGSLYGASLAGYYGTIFQLTPQAAGQTPWPRTELWSFGGGADGSYPQGPLIFDTWGALYGVTT